MRRVIVIAIALVLAFSLASCRKKAESQFKPVDLFYSYPHPAEQVTVLELGWGNGNYEVGYINNAFKEIVEKAEEGATIGPAGICVDGEESIYVDDTMNQRILKYDKDGRYVGQVARSRFTKHVALRGLYMLAGPDCIYLYEITKNIIYRYRFQDDELKSISIPEIGIKGRIQTLHAAYDGLGNSYFADMAIEPDKPARNYFVVDPSFSGVIGTRNIPARFAAIDYVDDLGDIYVVAKADPNPNNLVLYKIDPTDSVSTVAVYPKDIDDNPEVYMSREPVDPSDLIIYNGYYITRGGRLVERIKGSQQKIYRLSRDVTVYWMQERPYEDDDKSPFRIYRVDVAWDQLVDKSTSGNDAPAP